MSGSPSINLVTQLNLHCFQLRMMFIWLLLKVRLLLSFSWINQQHLILLTMIRSLILSTNKLKLNPDKTEFIVFGSKSRHEKRNHCFPVNIVGNLTSPVDAVRNLGVWFDSDFLFSYHVMKVCKACFGHVRDLM